LNGAALYILVNTHAAVYSNRSTDASAP